VTFKKASLLFLQHCGRNAATSSWTGFCFYTWAMYNKTMIYFYREINIFLPYFLNYFRVMEIEGNCLMCLERNCLRVRWLLNFPFDSHTLLNNYALFSLIWQLNLNMRGSECITGISALNKYLHLRISIMNSAEVTGLDLKYIFVKLWCKFTWWLFFPRLMLFRYSNIVLRCFNLRGFCRISEV